MNERLSRIDRYGHRNRTKQGAQAASGGEASGGIVLDEAPPRAKAGSADSDPAMPADPGGAPDKSYESAAVAALAKLKESVQVPPPPSSSPGETGFPGMTPMERKSAPLSGLEMLGSSGMEPDFEELPTRKEMFPSQRLKVTKWFYNSLLYTFLIILIYLLWWGVSDSPWGQNHGL